MKRLIWRADWVVPRQEVAAVVPEMLWIVGFYVAAAAWVHALYGRNADADARKRHYVLIAGNRQLQMEWYVRSLQYLSRRTGTDIGITVVLEQSSDETGAIVEMFAREDAGIELIRNGGVDGGNSKSGEAAEDRRQSMLRRLASTGKVVSADQVVWVDLENKAELQKLPL